MNKLYWRFQLGYWLGYLLLNVVYVRALGFGNQAYVTPLTLLSLLMFGVSHGLRRAYHQQTQQRSITVISLHLLWLLPVLSMLVQVAATLLTWLVASKQPLAITLAERLGSRTFVALSINTAIILFVWCMVFLLWQEWKRRQAVEREHWQQQLKVKDLELQFLRNQINSHFLFNALNNIRALVLEDAAAARQAMTDLATLLRGVLQEARSPTVPLRDELTLVKGYLALEALQLEGRLQTKFDIDAQLDSARVPPMLLQTLVENAVSHGIARRADGGCVHISARPVASERWCLQVSNPPPLAGAGREGHGIGLVNARERLRIAFAGAAQLTLTEGPDFLASVEMPLWTS